MLAKHALSQLSYAPVPEDECSTLNEEYVLQMQGRRQQQLNSKRANMVGLGRLELPTSRLSSARSNQLSYKPQTLLLREGSGTRSRAIGSRHATHSAKPSHSAKPLARVRPRRKRNEDGEIPPMQLNDPDDRWPLMFLKRFDRSKLLKNHP